MESEIVAETAALVTALERGDAVAAADVYSNGATVVAPAAGVIEGRDEIEAYWQAGIDLGLSAVTFDRHLLEDVAGGVIEAGRYAISGRREVARPRVDRGTYLVLHTLGPGGSWCRAVEVFISDEPNPARRDIHKEES